MHKAIKLILFAIAFLIGFEISLKLWLDLGFVDLYRIGCGMHSENYKDCYPK